MRDVKVEVPGQVYMDQLDRAVWEATGDFVAKVQRLFRNDERAFSLILSRVGREMRRTWDAETAQKVMQGIIDTMPAAAANDLDTPAP
jgi:hypothetical protein